MRYRYQIAGLLVLCAFVAVGADAQMVASHAPNVGGSGQRIVPEASKAGTVERRRIRPASDGQSV